MSKFNLEKAVEKAKFVVQKRNLPDVKAQVLMNIDVSGSAQGLFLRGEIQEAFQRVLPVGILFDDNREVDVFTFQSGENICHVEPTATEQNYVGYIEKNILKNKKVPLWGGTDYAPVIKENLRSMGFLKRKSVMEEVVTEKGGWFSKAKTEQRSVVKTVLESTSESGFPSIVYFFTDGENFDQKDTLAILQECQNAKTQMYFHFIGIGNANFKFIEMLGDKFDNTGFLNIRDLSKIDDDTIYEQLLPEELCTWLSAKGK
jgi:hypothetical protein